MNPGIERAVNLRQPDAALGKVVENRVLTKSGAPVKRHIGEKGKILQAGSLLFALLRPTSLEFALPDGMTYRAGYYLAMLVILIFM